MGVCLSPLIMVLSLTLLARSHPVLSPTNASEFPQILEISLYLKVYVTEIKKLKVDSMEEIIVNDKMKQKTVYVDYKFKDSDTKIRLINIGHFIRTPVPLQLFSIKLKVLKKYLYFLGAPSLTT